MWFGIQEFTDGANPDDAAPSSVRLAVVPTGARPETAIVTAIIASEESPGVAGGDTVRMTSELPSITAVPAVFGAPSSVTPWTAPKSGPGRSTMIGVGSTMIGVGSMMIGVGSMMIGVGWIRTLSL